MCYNHYIHQTKVTVIDDMLRVLYEDAVSYDMDLPEYRFNIVGLCIDMMYC